MTDAENPRVVLGRFLRARRERLRPGSLGFPDAGRRRTPGLRREEVAVAAGLSATWYTYLEQGRDKDVSPAVLDSLARVLQMTEDERRYMHFLVYGHAPRTERVADSAPADQLIRNIVAATDDYPYPVYAVDRSCYLLAWNNATAEWYDDWSKMPQGECNFARWLFSSEQARQRLVDWEPIARGVVARWRADLARGPLESATERSVERLKEQFPLFGHWWNEIIVEEHRLTVRSFNHPRLGVCNLRVVPLLTAYDDTPIIAFHFPQD